LGRLVCQGSVDGGANCPFTSKPDPVSRKIEGTLVTRKLVTVPNEVKPASFGLNVRRSAHHACPLLP
jgi:hypothetical protein